ncbi:MAG: hypothetical protein Ct9H300mP15_08030 [Gemmatimonadota bacterium]|nr:MAG: hypothetical protein Ct9H300mP15_08030 [Gemmatimonadota bacterium]
MSAATLKFILCCIVPIYSPEGSVTFSDNWHSIEEVSGVPRTIRGVFSNVQISSDTTE